MLDSTRSARGSAEEEVHEAYYQAVKKTEKDPSGGSWPAYSSGKSRDEVRGKVFYYNIIPDFAVKLELFYVIIITPVIHCCMSGLETDRDVATLGMPRGDLRPVRGRRDGWRHVWQQPP